MQAPVSDSPRAPDGLPCKQVYTSPVLQEFGAVHQFTQGTNSVGNDAGLGKSRNK
jgi:hypothetical protein